MTKNCLVKSKRRRRIIKYSALLAAVPVLTFLFFVYLFAPARNMPHFLRPLSGLGTKTVYSWCVKSSNPEKRNLRLLQRNKLNQTAGEIGNGIISTSNENNEGNVVSVFLSAERMNNGSQKPPF